MEQQNCAEETTNSENPLQGGNDLQGVEISEESFKANRKGFNLQKQKMTLKPAMTSGQSKMTSFIVVILNLEVNSSARRNIPDATEKNIDVTRATYSNLDVLQDKLNDDHWHVDVNRSLSDSWKGITKLTLLKENSPEGGRTKIQATTRHNNLWPGVWSAHKKEKQEWANEKPKLDNARRLRGIYFIDPEDG